jgi:hypothetical protein
LELRLSLADGDAVLKPASWKHPKQGTVVESEFIARNQWRIGCDGNGDVRRFPGRHSNEPPRSDADNRERVSFYSNLFAYNIKRPTKAALPEVISDNDHL